MKNTPIPYIVLVAALVTAAPLRAQTPQNSPQAPPAPQVSQTPQAFPAPQAFHGAPLANTVSPQASLVSRPWRFIADRWYAERVFASGGTFKTIGDPDQAGSWTVTPDGITLTFADGHSETISLPLDPAGTDCTDQNGKHFTAIIGKTIPVGAGSALNAHSPLDSNTSLDANPLDSSSLVTPRGGRQGRGNRQARPSDPVTSSAPALDPLAGLPPSAADQKQNAPIIAMLTSAPWKIIGQASVGTYLFDPSGAISTPRGDKSAGTWKISGTQLRLNFDKGGLQTLDLPLDPKGTDGADSHGIPIIALQQAPQPVTARVTRPPPATAFPVTTAPATTTPSSTFSASTPAPGPTATPAVHAHTSVVPDHPFGTALPPQQ